MNDAHRPSCNGPQAGGLALAALVATGCATVSPGPLRLRSPCLRRGSRTPARRRRRRGPELVGVVEAVRRPAAVRPASRARSWRTRTSSQRGRGCASPARDSASRGRTCCRPWTGRCPGAAAREAMRERSSSISASLDASWEPDVFGGTRKAVTAAQADAEASEASLHDAQVSLAAEVALDYVALRSYQARIAIARDSLETQSETLELTRWRAEAGLTSSLDVEQSRSSVEQTRAAIPNLRTALAETENRLAILLGVAPGTLHDELTDVRAVPRAASAARGGDPGRYAASETRRPGFGTAAGGRDRAARPSARRPLPEPPPVGLARSRGADPRRGLQRGRVVRSLLGSLTGPLFDRGRIYRQIEIQDAQVEQARASSRALRADRARGRRERAGGAREREGAPRRPGRRRGGRAQRGAARAPALHGGARRLSVRARHAAQRARDRGVAARQRGGHRLVRHPALQGPRRRLVAGGRPSRPVPAYETRNHEHLTRQRNERARGAPEREEGPRTARQVRALVARRRGPRDSAARARPAAPGARREPAPLQDAGALARRPDRHGLGHRQPAADQQGRGRQRAVRPRRRRCSSTTTTA